MAIAEAADVAVEGGAEANTNGTVKRAAGVYVSTPSELRERLEREAEAAGKSPAVYVRELLASHFNVTLPAPRTRKKYTNPDEAKAAQRTQQKTRAEAIKLLKQKYAAELEAMMAQAKQNVEASGEGAEGQATA